MLRSQTPVKILRPPLLSLGIAAFRSENDVGFHNKINFVAQWVACLLALLAPRFGYPTPLWLTSGLPTGSSRVHLAMHWITLTGFVLAPPPVLGLRWRHLCVSASLWFS